MRTRAHTRRHGSLRASGENHNQTDAVVATVWLAFYAIALVVAITSPLLTRTIEIATR